MSELKAPFPYFGGKSRAASLIWERFGNTPNYVEPFAGSLAVLLARPHAPKTETVNDMDGLLSNAWRAIRADPDAVAYYADQPVVEVDLHARHVTLVAARETITARLMADPEFYDPQLAGFWLWGACNWIGSGWCDGSGPWVVQDGMLVNRREVGELAGVSRKLPHLGDAGAGVSRPSIGVSRKLPNISSHGSGTNSERAQGITKQIPHLNGRGEGQRVPNIGSEGLYEWMRDLSARLKRVRIACGDWTRVMGDSVTTKHGLTAVLLDPPYDAEDADNAVYGTAYDGSLSGAAWAWAVENGNNPLLRIAFCGYADGRELPAGWVEVPWKARKGYQKADEDGSHNGHREVVWFSPHCLKPARRERPVYAPPEQLFGGMS